MEKQKLNSTLIYILSALGFLCCCIGGFIPSGIAFFIANNKMKAVEENPDDFENIEGMKTAKTVALVLFCINLLVFIWILYRIYTVGWDELSERFKEAMEEARRQNQ
jgi:hypothetical protein